MADLRSWKRNLKDMVNYPWEYSGNSDHPDCPKCGNSMNFHGHDDNGDFPFGEGYWECPNCRFKISEEQLY